MSKLLYVLLIQVPFFIPVIRDLGLWQEQTPKKLKLSPGEEAGRQSAASGVAVWLLRRSRHLMLLRRHTHGHEVTEVKSNE